MHIFFQIILLTSTSLALNNLTASDKNIDVERVPPEDNCSLVSHSTSVGYTAKSSLKNSFSLHLPNILPEVFAKYPQLQQLKHLAEQGNIDAQLQLAETYKYGAGVPQNFLEAFYYYDLVAGIKGKRGMESIKDVRGLCPLGELYYFGKGVPQNYKQARIYFEWLYNNRHLINADHVDKIDANHVGMAANYLGEIYYFGKGVPQNYEKARIYFEWVLNSRHLIAANHVGMAANYLGEIYYFGKGVPQNYEKARIYFEWVLNNRHLIAVNHVGMAANYVGKMYYYGKGVLQNYEKARIYFEWVLNRHQINADHVDKIDASHVGMAANYVGKLYYYGRCVLQNYEQARTFFELAAVHNHIEAQYNVGFMYIKENGAEKSTTKGEKYLKLAANNGYLIAQRLLGEIYSAGLYGCPINHEEAFSYYKLAADQGDAEAQGYVFKVCKREADRGHVGFQRLLGEIYSAGLYGRPINHEEAFQYFKLAADQGDAKAQGNVVEVCKREADSKHIGFQKFLGKIYLKGLYGCPINHEEAFSYYKLAANQGDAEAQGNVVEVCKRGADSKHIGFQRLLGEIYLKGLYGHSINHEEAVKFFTLAANQGDRLSRHYLNFIPERRSGLTQGLSLKPYLCSASNPKKG